MRLLVLALTVLTSTSALAADLSGKYSVKGNNPGGSGYNGTLTLVRKGDAYALSWESGGISTGIGVAFGDALAVAVGDGCAVAGYQVNAEGGLDGKWTGPQGGAVASEQAVPGIGTTKGLAGDYVVKGSNADGKPYKGGLGIVVDDPVLRFSWRTGSNFEGYGIQLENRIAAVWGNPGCGVVLYRVTADGILSGIWKYPDSAIGNETATR
jgi:hypothetical protein